MTTPIRTVIMQPHTFDPHAPLSFHQLFFILMSEAVVGHWTVLENGIQGILHTVNRLHAIVGRAPSLRGDPVDVLTGALDVTCLAVNAVLSIDLQSHALCIFPRDKLIHSCWTETLLWPIIDGEISLHRHCIIGQCEVRGLVIMIGS